jgi:hypothetical protein
MRGSRISAALVFADALFTVVRPPAATLGLMQGPPATLLAWAAITLAELHVVDEVAGRAMG